MKVCFFWCFTIPSSNMSGHSCLNPALSSSHCHSYVKNEQRRIRSDSSEKLILLCLSACSRSNRLLDSQGKMKHMNIYIKQNTNVSSLFNVCISQKQLNYCPHPNFRVKALHGCWHRNTVGESILSANPCPLSSPSPPIDQE